MNINQLSGRLCYFCIFSLFVFFVFSLGGYYPNFKTQEKIRQKTIEEIRRIGFYEPRIDNSSNEKFINTTKRCIEYINLELRKDQQIPTILIVAQAIIESNHGTSRFAVEGNNLMGIRIFNTTNGMLPLKQPASITWRVKTYKTKCASIRDYISILNNNNFYSKFRQTRLRTKDPIKLAETLENYSTSQTYRTEIVRMITKIKDKI